ncbi:MAG TPA: type II toxin-antitoxin system VapC family toxin [Vicinamibacterales bacterium]|nr:type II toxin-antitoxin system VapC family toxin [Vicinamibacterales bacterium]
MAVAYLDSSALVKLVVVEDETPALEADLAARDGLVASVLVVVECGRAVRRAGGRRVLQRAGEVLEAVYLMDLSLPLLEEAAALQPRSIRSLDAIHIATALSVDEPDLEVITYDARMAEAARANGLRVVQPGR